MVKIVVTGKLPKNPIVVEGFPSKGFVSTIATNYMVRELGMKLVGYIEVEELKSIIIVRDYVPLRPIRIYVKDNLVLIYSEVIVPYHSIPALSAALNKWLDSLKPKLIVLMAGISGTEPSKGHQILGVTSKKELASMLKGLKLKVLEDGVLTGVSSDILMHCVEKNMPAIGLMVETEYNPDALAATTMLEILNKLLKIKIDIDSLKKMGNEIENEFRSIMKQMKKGREGYVKLEECGHMYG